MTQSPRRTQNKQHGPRSQRVVRSLLDAALAELVDKGYARLSMDAVAKRAGVHRSTLYRRFPTKAQLIGALLHPPALQEHDRSLPLTERLLVLCRQFSDSLSSPEGQVLARVLSTSDPELQAMTATARDQSRSLFLEILEQEGVQEAEQRAHLLFYGVVHWVLERGRAATEQELEGLIGLVLPKD
ncbi:MAG: helix-turn-helix domain-containing protein [Myxococcota bacterium]|nr:helix-turn-helix domain-containing protein [Myxococcota bacterium]